MDKERKRQLKKQGKAEVQRVSDALHKSLQEANPLPPGAPGWADSYKLGIQREKWLKSELPVLHEPELSQLFSVRPYPNRGWLPHVGAYVQCQSCGSAIPCARKKRFFDRVRCRCKNIVWWQLFKWRKVVIKKPENVVPIKLIGSSTERVGL